MFEKTTEAPSVLNDDELGSVIGGSGQFRAFPEVDTGDPQRGRRADDDIDIPDCIIWNIDGAN